MQFPKAEFRTVSNFRGGFNDIVAEILAEDAEKDHTNFYRLAQSLKGKSQTQTLKNVWAFVRKNVRYIEDGRIEKVKSPARTLADGFGDCKSMALLSGALIKNLGFPYRYRVARYDPNNPEQGHIYVITEAERKKTILDPVHSVFNKEEKFWKKMDTQIQRLRGINQIPENVQLANNCQNGADVRDCCVLAVLLFLFMIE